MNHLLPPGPWEARGNRVTTGNGQTICVVFFHRHAADIARAIERLPDLEEEIEELKARVAELEGRLTDDN